jgi:hypothetical protein
MRRAERARDFREKPESRRGIIPWAEIRETARRT